MSILIHGMEMPRDEYDSIHILRDGTAVVYRTGSIDFYKAIPVPEHGRLIDAFNTVKKLCDCGYYNSAEIVSDMPTVIPADKEGET